MFWSTSKASGCKRKASRPAFRPRAEKYATHTRSSLGLGARSMPWLAARNPWFQGDTFSMIHGGDFSLYLNPQSTLVRR